MATSKPFRAESGFDAADSKIINVSDPSLPTDVVNLQYWKQNTTVQAFDSTRSYTTGFIVIHDDRLWYANKDLVKNTSWSDENWNIIKTDVMWDVITPNSDTLILQNGQRANINTSVSAFTLTLPAIMDPDQIIVLHDSTGNANTNPVLIQVADPETQTIYSSDDSYYMNVPWSIIYLYPYNNNWVVSVQRSDYENLVGIAEATKLLPYKLASREIAYSKTSQGTFYYSLPEYPNDKDSVSIIDADGDNLLNHTTVSVASSSTDTISDPYDGSVTSLEYNFGGEVRFIYDKSSQEWSVIRYDLRTRVTKILTSYTATVFDEIILDHNTNDNIEITLPINAVNGDIVSIFDKSTQTSSVTLQVDPNSNDTIYGDPSIIINKPYSYISSITPESVPSNTSLTYDTDDQNISMQLWYDANNTRWIIYNVHRWIEYVDPDNLDRPGVITLANQNEANAQNYMPDNESDAVVDNKAITPKTLDKRRSTETLAGLSRIATSSELQVVSDSNDLRDDIIVTPKKLDERQSTETIRGVLAVATSTDMDSITNDIDAVTPKKFHEQTATSNLSGVVTLVSPNGSARTNRNGNGSGIFDINEDENVITPNLLNKYRATENQPGALWIATQLEVNTQKENTPVDNSIVTPKKLSNLTSTDTRRGLARIATQNEANEMIDSTDESYTKVIITPETLNNRNATESLTGIAAITTTTLLDAGSDNNTIITPSKLNYWLSKDHFTTNSNEGLEHSGNIWDGVTFNLLPSSTDQIGAVRLATQNEADVETDSDTGTTADNTIAITPFTLDGRRANTTLYGITRLATQSEMDTTDETLGNDEAVSLTPANMFYWIRSATEARANNNRYGSTRIASATQTFVGDGDNGSTRPLADYDKALSVSPYDLNYALQYFLPITGKAADTDLLDGIDSESFVRSDEDDSISGNLSFTGSDFNWTFSTGDLTFEIDDVTNSSNWKTTYGSGELNIGLNDTNIISINPNSLELTFDEITQNGDLTATGNIKENNLLLSETYLGITDNAVSASILKNSRTISLSGDVDGSGEFDGSSDIDISIQVEDNSHNHSGSNITTGVVNQSHLPSASTGRSGIVQLSESTSLDSNTTAATSSAAKNLQDQLDNVTQNGGTGTNITYTDYIQIGSVRLSTNDNGALEFTYGWA